MNVQLFDYDDTDINSIYSYAKKLEGMTFHEVLDEYERSPIKSYRDKLYDVCDSFANMVVKEESVSYDTGVSLNDKAKGQLGNFIEKYYFGYD